MFNSPTKKKSRLKLDFRTKLFTTVVLSYVLLLGNLQQKFIYVAIAASVLPYILFIIDGKYTYFITFICSYDFNKNVTRGSYGKLHISNN